MTMTNIRSFKSKIVIPVAIVLVTLTVALTSYASALFLSYSEELINGKITVGANSLQRYINDCKSFSRAAAIAITHKPEVIRAVKDRDREALHKYLTSMLELYHVNFITITDDAGAVIIRSYEYNTYGDTITNQQNIQNALRGEVSTFFETGTLIKVSVRTGAPIYDRDGTLLGVVSTGIRFDSDHVVDEMKKHFQSEVSIFLGDTRISTTIFNDGKRIVGSKISADAASSVFGKRSMFIREVNVLGVTYKAVYVPLFNPADSVFASFSIGIPLEELRAKANGMILSIVIISLAVLIVAAVALFGIISTLSKPLIALSKNVNDIENGNFDISIGTNSSDEIGHVSRSLQRLVNTVRELIDGINKTISENQKGKSYRIDTESFRGEYKLLAERIVELSDFSTKDKLTGLVNRRTFDTRLDLEWARAMRDNTPLSLLMMDIDHFKVYNDRHGHRQGDAALQTVADILTDSIKRGVDLAARWGGEEFAVLLPNTAEGGAAKVATKIRRAIECADVPDLNGDGSKNITISIGVYTQIPTADSSLENLLSKADAALYYAKNAGRNTVCKYGTSG